MTSPLIEDYLRWLMPQLREEEDSRTYWDLLRVMYEKEFVWLVPHDDNRMADAFEVRREYLRQVRKPHADLGPCSFAEVLIGLSRRMAFDAGGAAPNWAWHLVTNLELQRMNDPLSTSRARRVDDILTTCIYRTYRPDGQGGFFPLGWPDEDQTKVELWYQMSAYIDQMHPEH